MQLKLVSKKSGNNCYNIFKLKRSSRRREDREMALLSVSEVGKIYTTRFGGNKVEALKSVTFDVEKGDFVAIMGESGSG